MKRLLMMAAAAAALASAPVLAADMGAKSGSDKNLSDKTVPSAWGIFTPESATRNRPSSMMRRTPGAACRN